MQDACWRHGDFNADFRATGADYTIWADNYNDWYAWPVPEPACAVLLALGAWALMRRRHGGRP